MMRYDFPFLGQYKNPVELNHGHSGARCVLPTTATVRVSGTNMAIEELAVPKKFPCKSHISKAGSTDVAVIPMSARHVTVPNDGAEYVLTTSVECPYGGQHCSKLILSGQQQSVKAHARRDLPVTLQLRAGKTPYVQVQTCDGFSDVDCGDDILLSVPDGVLKVFIPAETPVARAHPVTEAPQMNTRFYVDSGETVVEVTLPNDPGHVEVRCGSMKDRAVRRATLRLDAAHAHDVEVNVFAVDGRTRLQNQQLSIPALAPKPIEVRVEETEKGKSIVAPSPGATVSVVSQQGPAYPGIPGIVLPPDESHRVAIAQPSGGEVQLHLPASGDMKWASRAQSCIEQHRNNIPELKNLLQAIHTKSPSGSCIIHYLLSLLSAPVPSISFHHRHHHCGRLEMNKKTKASPSQYLSSEVRLL